MKGAELLKTNPPPKRIERQYAKGIEKLMKGLKSQINGISSPFLIVAQIRRFARSPTFIRQAYSLARAMATHVFSDGHKTWRQAARKGSQGRMIYEALKKELSATSPVGKAYARIIEDNAKYIGSMPEDIAKWVNKRIASNYEDGKRASDVVKDILAEYPHITKSRAELIARTETSKASTALTRARAVSVGLSWYVWRTSDDARVRSSHAHMEGVVVNWSDPPSPEKLIGQKSYGNYHAGDIFNCRCYPEPLTAFDDISWPAKVYYQGKIQRITLSKFKKIAKGGR